MSMVEAWSFDGVAGRGPMRTEVKDEDAGAHEDNLAGSRITPPPAEALPLPLKLAVSPRLVRVVVEGNGGGAVVHAATREPPFGEVGVASEPQTFTRPSFINIGSVGHPALCSRPCLYIDANDCANGASCEFCHLDHPKRMAHLSKVHREQLRDMDRARAKALLLPLVREKALAFDSSAGTASAVDSLSLACGVYRPERMRWSKEERSLIKVLSGMPVRLLLIILERSVLHNEPEAQSAAEALFVQLRNSVMGPLQ